MQLRQILRKIATSQLRDDALKAAFDNVAYQLMVQNKLVCGKRSFYIRELEFYFHSLHCAHPDPYCKRDERQLEFAAWHFRGFVWKQDYTPARNRGLELVFGNHHFYNYGGILIRQIQDIDSGHIIDTLDGIVAMVIETLSMRHVTAYSLARHYDVFGTLGEFVINPHLPTQPATIVKRRRPNLWEPPEHLAHFWHKRYNYYCKADNFPAL